MKKHSLSSVALMVSVLAIGCGSAEKEPEAPVAKPEAASKAGVFEGSEGTLPAGEISSYAELDADGNPKSIGFKFQLAMLDKMPKDMNPKSLSFDINGNGKIEMDLTKMPPLVEMLGDYAARLDLPKELQGRDDIPFTFLMFNWNPMGHPPMGWMTPHCDFHFYMVPQAEVDAIKAGPIPHVIDKEGNEKGLKPVPDKYMAAGFTNTEPPSTVGGMGNHLIDPTSPEIVDPMKSHMTHTWIYGTYDGHVTFWEPMISREWLNMKQDAVVDIKLPKSFEKAGWYPTKYAIRHAADGTCTVSVEDFVKRDAG